MIHHRVEVLLLNLPSGVSGLRIRVREQDGAAWGLNQKRRLMFPRNRDIGDGNESGWRMTLQHAPVELSDVD